ncbi:MAG: hypothetical protein ACTS3R_13240 [Inquilinaceae bacterium]
MVPWLAADRRRKLRTVAVIGAGLTNIRGEDGQAGQVMERDLEHGGVGQERSQGGVPSAGIIVAALAIVT